MDETHTQGVEVAVARRILRKTKIIATIGPASDSLATIKAMLRAGMNVARLNFSHGTHDEHHRRVETLRQASQELDTHVAIMLDTRGVEIRTGRLAEGEASLKPGERFVLYAEDRLGDASGVSITYAELAEDVSEGTRVMIDDGVIELRVEHVKDAEVHCRVVRGGRLGDRKGVNVPDVTRPHAGLCPEDREAIGFAVEHGLAYIAASFVRSAEDVQAIRQVLEAQGAQIPPRGTQKGFGI